MALNFLKGKWTAKLVLLLLKSIEKFFIENQPKEIKDGLMIIFAPVKKSVSVLVDEDPEDTKQLKKVWKEFIQSERPWDYGEEQLRTLVLTKMEGSEYKEVILPVLTPVIDSLQVLVDEDPSNIQQIQDIWDEFKDEEDFENFVKTLLEVFLKDRLSPETIASIYEMIDFFIENEG